MVGVRPNSIVRIIDHKVVIENQINLSSSEKYLFTKEITVRINKVLKKRLNKLVDVGDDRILNLSLTIFTIMLKII